MTLVVQRAFGRYVFEEVAESFSPTPEASKPYGEEREATILLSRT